MSTHLSLTSFQKLFSPNIRAMLNWDLLEQENAFVDTIVINEHHEIASLFTVWHVNPEGGFADWDDHTAVPLTVGKSLSLEPTWPAHRLQNVSKFQKGYEESSEPVNLMIPVYSAGKRFVLLDSTHRAGALHRGKLDFTAMLVVLNGPADERVLPDLRWHANNG